MSTTISKKRKASSSDDVDHCDRNAEVMASSAADTSAPLKKHAYKEGSKGTATTVCNVIVEYLRPKYKDLREWCEDE
jgi:hypothetical protein